MCKFLQIFTPKKANFDKFSQKSAISKNFPLLKVKNMEKFFHNFFAHWGKNDFFGAKYSPMHLQNILSSTSKETKFKKII